VKIAVQMHCGKSWDKIAALVPGRSARKCNSRWSYALDPSIVLTAGRTGKWTEEEDLKLKNSVQMHGDEDWVRIAKLVLSRTNS
jgi:hypothetical protein